MSAVAVEGPELHHIKTAGLTNNAMKNILRLLDRSEHGSKHKSSDVYASQNLTSYHHVTGCQAHKIASEPAAKPGNLASFLHSNVHSKQQVLWAALTKIKIIQQIKVLLLILATVVGKFHCNSWKFVDMIVIVIKLSPQTHVKVLLPHYFIPCTYNKMQILFSQQTATDGCTAWTKDTESARSWYDGRP